MADFEPAFNKTMVAEGGYKLTNIKGDAGKQTYAGISRVFHPTWKGWLEIDAGRIPPTEWVREFYLSEFWSKVKAYAIKDQSIAEAIYDMAVNGSPDVAIKLAQIVVGTAPDGAIGPKTLSELNTILPRLFLAEYCIARIARREVVVTKKPSQLKFFLGWVRRDLKGAK